MTHPSVFARETPDRPAFIMAETGEVLTYLELDERAGRCANLYAKLGLKEGDVVALLVENGIRFPELVWAAKNSGLRYVAVNTHLNGPDAAYVVADSGAKVLVASHAFAAVAHDVLQSVRIPGVMLDGAAPGFAAYEAMLADCSPVFSERRRRGASMLYSSGTTGKPKAIRTQIADVPPTTPPQRFNTITPQYEFGADTVFANPGPFYHAGPLRFMMTIHRCGGVVIGFRKFAATTLLEAIDARGVTHGFFVPTMFRRLLEHPERQRYDVSTMRHAIHGAAPCPHDVKRAMIDWWGPVIDELYSGTEAVGHTFISSQEWLARPGSVGRAAPGCTIKIVDAEGRTLPAGEAGRIFMSNGLRVEYFGGAADAPLIGADGFASLGDIGLLDEDGYLYLTDREKHMIIVGGVNIYPQEAEAVLLDHPEVADAAVIGVPHDDLGEEVKAVIELVAPERASAELERAIIDFCKQRISPFKCPRSVDFVDALPRDPLGKLAKWRLKERYWGAERSI